MANNGGPAYPDPDPDAIGIPGMSVRDAFSVAIVKNSHLTQEGNADTAVWIYGFAQILTDEKLRRDKADRAKGRQDER